GAFELIGVGLDITIAQLDAGAEGADTGDMQIDGAGTDRTSARSRNPRTADAGEEWAKHDKRGAHGLNQLIGCLVRVQLGSVEFDGMIADPTGVDAKARKELHRGTDVAQTGDIMDDDWFGGEHRRHH